jgi:hypothetical protein
MLLCIYFKALRENEYFFAGQAVAMSLVHGGGAPKCLSKQFYYTIIDGQIPRKSVTLADVPNSEYKVQISEVKVFKFKLIIWGPIHEEILSFILKFF